ncbi:MAG TPA: hypothetical protein VFI29_14675, partial [Hanamia sp.]|nr:hypothetical protein [Hanamia sp.]
SIDIQYFNHYNPGFDNTLATGATYNLQLPKEKMKDFFEKRYEILNESVNQLLESVNMNSKNLKNQR